MFKPAKQNRIFQDVVDQIQNAILSGKVNPGDILPSERDLREMFKVSRGTIREALRVLEQKGLIEIKLGVGGGAVVREASIDKVSESLALLIRHRRVPMRYLAEFREGVEGDMAALAVQRATPEILKELERVTEIARIACNKGAAYVRQFLDADMHFHLTLARASKNPIYEAIERIIHGNILSYYQTFIDLKGIALKKNCRDFSEIVEAIRRKQPEAARAAIRRHISRYATYMETVKEAHDTQKD